MTGKNWEEVTLQGGLSQA